VPSPGLRVLRIFDFQPPGTVVLVDAAFALRNNTFQIPSANLLKKGDAPRLDMLSIDNFFAIALLNQIPQTMFSFNEREAAEVFVVKPQQVEGVEDRLAPPREQFIELADSSRIEAHDFTIENRVLHGQIVERFFQRVKRLEAIQVSGNEFAFASVDVREHSEAVVFQFKDIIGIVKGLRYQPEPHRVNA
jgi:hypothetical protein